MAAPFLPPSLGYHVTYREFSWEQIVLAQWGEGWTIPETVYRWSNGREFKSSDMSDDGFYNRD